MRVWLVLSQALSLPTYDNFNSFGLSSLLSPLSIVLLPTHLHVKPLVSCLSFLFYLSLCHSHFWPLPLFRFPNTLFHRPLTSPTCCLYLIQWQLKTLLVFDAATLKQLNHSLCLIQWHMWPQFIQQLAIHPSTQKAFPFPPPPLQ